MIEGTTDSEHLFALIVDHVLCHGAKRDPAEVLAEAFLVAIGRVEALAAECGVTARTFISAVLTDGRHAVAVRYTDGDLDEAESLYLHTGSRYAIEGGVGRMVELRDDDSSVIVASEPLTTEGGWVKVPSNTLVVVRGDRTVDIRPVAPACLGTETGDQRWRRSGQVRSCSSGVTPTG